MKLTKWYDGHQKPARDGVYQRKYPLDQGNWYCLFKNGVWYGGKSNLHANFDDSLCFGPSLQQNLPWRGVKN